MCFGLSDFSIYSQPNMYDSMIDPVLHQSLEPSYFWRIIVWVFRFISQNGKEYSHKEIGGDETKG